MNGSTKKLKRSGNSHAGHTLRIISHGYFGADKLTASERVIANAFYTFTQKGAKLDFTFLEIHRRYNLGYATVARAVHKLLTLCFERADEPHSYKLKEALPLPRYFYVPDWYRHAVFPLGDGTADLTNDQIEVLAYIAHQNAHIPHWRTTQAAIARELEIAPSTVSEAVTLFEALNILTVRSVDGHTRSVNHFDRASFLLNNELLEQVRSGTVQRLKAPKRAVRAADECADRDRFYEARRRLANEHLKRVRKVLGDEYAELERKFGVLEMEFAKAEHNALMQKCAEIVAKRKEIQSAMRDCLAKYGYTSADLEPRYICPDCSDTGWRGDGRPCSCYAPPGGKP